MIAIENYAHQSRVTLINQLHTTPEGRRVFVLSAPGSLRESPHLQMMSFLLSCHRLLHFFHTTLHFVGGAGGGRSSHRKGRVHMTRCGVQLSKQGLERSSSLMEDGSIALPLSRCFLGLRSSRYCDMFELLEHAYTLCATHSKRLVVIILYYPPFPDSCAAHPFVLFCTSFPLFLTRSLTCRSLAYFNRGPREDDWG